MLGARAVRKSLEAFASQAWPRVYVVVVVVAVVVGGSPVLQSTQRTRDTRPNMVEHTSRYLRRRRRSRWHVLLTLVNNPRLRLDRKPSARRVLPTAVYDGFNAAGQNDGDVAALRRNESLVRTCNSGTTLIGTIIVYSLSLYTHYHCILTIIVYSPRCSHFNAGPS